LVFFVDFFILAQTEIGGILTSGLFLLELKLRRLSLWQSITIHLKNRSVCVQFSVERPVLFANNQPTCQFTAPLLQKEARFKTGN
jgi:hypothetical protein